MSLNQRLAAYLREREGLWIDGRVLSRVAGAYAWRSRLSDLRRAPYHMTIENRQRRVYVSGVVAMQEYPKFVISEYRLVPAAPQAQEHRT